MEDMKRITSDEARSHFSKRLNEVQYGGEHTEVQRHGKTSVVWVPVEWYERAKAALTREEEGR